MSTTLPRLDAITGAPLIGTWTSSLLYMAELLQAVYYFRTFKTDNWRLKSYVAAAFAIDTISAIGDYACVYLYTITHAGDLVYLTKQNWGVPLYIISTTTVALMVQSFLVFLYWRFAKNTIIVCCLSILILAALGGGIASGVTVVLFPTFKDRRKVRISGTFWNVAQASADLLIAGALVRELMRAKSVFKGQRRANNMLNRLLLHIIQTGTATAVITVVALIVFLIDDQSNVPIGMMYSLGRLYVLSMLMNLNTRISDSGRAQNAGTTSGQRGTVRFAHGITYNFTTEFYPSEPHSSNNSSNGEPIKSSALLPTLQSPASISETQPPEIEMMPTDTKQVQRSDATCI
ncbi:hypothetical protein MSAN_01118700 [Mycena sanguinolenta]|uniref:DUF6534 domain-containing protein n=1 Tax=Mycena sanguinolenta TaxID=230812 RepID=A0A8H6YN28_9AGAR|nr:hypothetical protein MSAN_01118700 [Mycena sanguinolenta]